MACVPDGTLGVEQCKALPVFVCDVADDVALENVALNSIEYMERVNATDPNDPVATYNRIVFADGTEIWTDSDGTIVPTPTPPAGTDLIPQQAQGGIRPMYELLSGAAAIWSIPESADFLVSRVIIEVITVTGGSNPTLTTDHGTFALFEGQRIEFVTTSREESLIASLDIANAGITDEVAVHWTENDRG